MSLPTYQEAVTKPLLIELVAPYLDAQDLAVASRVSKQWEKTCSPILWGDPLKILSKKNNPYTSSYEFMEQAVLVRAARRHLIQKLDFRLLVSLKFQHHKDFDLYLEVLNGYYILDICYHLDNVKFLIMDGIEDWSLPARYGYLTAGFGIEVPEEYHPRPKTQQISSSTSLNTASVDNGRSDVLAHSKPSTITQHRCRYRPISPQLWSLKGCSHICGMRAVCLPSIQTGALTFLDLSYMDNSTEWSRSFSELPFEQLRILKLRGLHMTDSYLPKLLRMENYHNLWSLDLRDNLFTDAVLAFLCQWFLPNRPLRVGRPTSGLYRLPPSYRRDQESPNKSRDETMPLRSDTKDAFLRHMAANPHAIDNAETDYMMRNTGLTHLYLADNKISSDGVRHLFFLSDRLHLLDIGTTRDPKDTLFKSRYAVSWDHGQSNCSLGIARSDQLSSLRIHHSIITCMPTVTPRAGSEGTTSPATYSLLHLHFAEKLARERITSGSPSFSPMKNSNIETLTLTGVPTKSYGFLIETLISFLHACRKQEKELANALATAHRRSPEVLPGLKTLRLEFLPPDSIESMAFSRMGSVSGDPDADLFSEASQEDFSFFTDNIERPTRPLSPGSRENLKSGWTYASMERSLLDVVEELKKAREEAGEDKWGGSLELALPYIRG